MINRQVSFGGLRYCCVIIQTANNRRSSLTLKSNYSERNRCDDVWWEFRIRGVLDEKVGKVGRCDGFV